MTAAYRNLYKSKYFITLIVAIGCFLFTYFYYDFFYADYEALNDSFYSGKLTEGMPFWSIYFLGNIGTSHLYSLLYQLNPNVEWISWILYSYLFVSCFIGLYIVIRILPQHTPFWIKIAAQVFIYLLVFADHNIHFIYTRVSYMTTGISLIALLYFFQEKESIRRGLGLFIFLNFWFVVGTLTRSESATAAFLQIGFFGVFYLRDVRRFAILYLFPTLFLFSILFAIGYDLKTTTEYYKQVEPEIEAQFCERNNMVPLSDMKTSRDSAKYKAATTILWSDPKILTPEYMRSLVRDEKFIYTDVRQWERVFNDLTSITLRFWYLGILCVLLGIGLMFIQKRKSKLSTIIYLSFVSSFWILTALQTYTVKVNDRSFLPLISLFIFCHIVMLLPHLRKRLSAKAYPFLAGIALIFVVHLYNLKLESNQLKSDLRDYHENLKAITEIASGKYLVVNSTSCDYIFSSNKPFYPFDFSAFKKIYIADGFIIPFLPYYRRYLEKECECNMEDFPSFWNYLRTRNSEVIVLSIDNRINTLREYLHEVHQYNLPLYPDTTIKLQPVQKSDNRGNHFQLNFYKLEL
jgi:hypothetical protein